ncbi:MAG TPA: ATP-binding protein [Candidatus Nitrosotenuis sp.]|nr:ATP-binding protein [Candidatus Nitrosotenuis sp.]
MSDTSPYFFMKELSNEELIRLLVSKIKELKIAKEKAEELNVKLQDNMAKLEETQQALSQQRDQLKEEVKKKAEELLKVERLSAIGQLSARIAHDLRNPLSVIQNTSKILRIRMESKLDEKSRQQWSRMDRAIYRMSHQLEDVMDYVRMPRLEKKNYSLAMALQDAIERIDVPPNVTIHPPLNDCTVFCDPEKMEIVFVNLLINAIQAIEGKEGTIKITITEDNKENLATVTISDSGMGIPDDLLEKIFEPLFTTKQVGTGLGLSSCKSIVEQHGGSITASSVVGKGSTFTIKIPIRSDWDYIGGFDNNQTDITMTRHRKGSIWAGS